MAGSIKDDVLDSYAGPATPAGEASDLVISAEDMKAMAEAESAQRDRLKAEDQVEVYVPRNITLSSSLLVNINGVAIAVPIETKVKVPASVAEMVNIRVSGAGS